MKEALRGIEAGVPDLVKTKKDTRMHALNTHFGNAQASEQNTILGHFLSLYSFFCARVDTHS